MCVPSLSEIHDKVFQLHAHRFIQVYGSETDLKLYLTYIWGYENLFFFLGGKPFNDSVVTHLRIYYCTDLST